MRRTALLAMVAALSAAQAMVPPGPTEPEVRVVSAPLATYPVEGVTLTRIRRSIRDNAPQMHYRRTARARASSRMDWQLREVETDEGCRITSFTVLLTQGLLMPDWRDRDEAAPEARRKWDAFYADLLRHERVHLANALDAANDLARRIRTLGMFPDCDALRSSLARTKQSVIGEYERIDREFDAKERRRPDLLR